jgi:hypothetical protein
VRVHVFPLLFEKKERYAVRGSRLELVNNHTGGGAFEFNVGPSPSKKTKRARWPRVFLAPFFAASLPLLVLLSPSSVLNMESAAVFILISFIAGLATACFYIARVNSISVTPGVDLEMRSTR